MVDAPPLHEGQQRLTTRWSLTLPFPMARRVDDGALVFWHTPRGFTAWLNVYNASRHATATDVIEGVKRRASPDRFDEIIEQGDGVLRYAYRLDESAGDGRLPAFYTNVATAAGEHLTMAVYFNFAEQFDDALSMWRSVTWA